MFDRSENAKAVNSKWHLFRINARRTANSPEEFSDSDQVEYDLDTARITGADNSENFTYDKAVDILGENGTDVRELEDR